MKPFSYTVNDAIAINLEGEFDACVVAQQRENFEGFSQKKKNVVVDMSNVYFIDSSGIGALVFLYKRLISRKLTLSVVGLSGQPKDLFEMLHLNKTLDCFDSIESFLKDHYGEDSADFDLETGNELSQKSNDINSNDFIQKSH